MKKMKLWSIILLMVMSMSLLVSCGSDDGDDVAKKIESPIIGTWKITATRLTYTLQFTETGKVSWESVVEGKKETATGTFEVSSGYSCIAKIYWKNATNPEVWEIVVSGNKMTTKSITGSAELTWTRQ